MSENGNGKARPSDEEALSEAKERLEEKLDAWRDKHYGSEDKDEGNYRMKGFNRAVMVGRLTRDPEVKQTKTGRSVTDINLAVNEEYTGRDGKPVERVCFIEVAAWGKLAETCGEYLKKGGAILVEGHLRLDRWQAADGQKRSKHRITADRIQFLSGDRRNTEVNADDSPEAEAPAA